MDKHPSRLARRTFLKTTAAGAVGGVLLPRTASAARQPAASDCPVRLGISTYSYWHFEDEPTPIGYVIEEAARLGVSGVDILHRQMESEDPDYLRSLKRDALLHGIDLNCLSTHSDFVTPDPAERQESIDDTQRYIRLARDLGIPCIRISAGRWNTTDSFAELMERGGEEPPIEGYTEEDAFDWCIEALEECVPVAEEHGVMLALENHWGLTRTAEGLLRIYEAIDSPWLGVLMDTGNFLERTYEQIEMIAPYTVYVQAKTYQGGGRFYTLDIDYERVAQILREADYRGFVSIEFEGEASSEEAVADSIELLRAAFAA